MVLKLLWSADRHEIRLAIIFQLISSAAQVLVTALKTYLQLTIMLMMLVIGLTASYPAPHRSPVAVHAGELVTSWRCPCSTVWLACLCTHCNDAHGDHAGMRPDSNQQVLGNKSFTGFTLQLEGVIILSVLAFGFCLSVAFTQ